MAVLCGDCGQETRVSGRFRVCDACGTRTMLAGRAVGKSVPNLQNIPIRTPDGRRIRDAFPLVTLELNYREAEERMARHLERELLFTGGGAVNTCHTCGCATGECECLAG